MDLVLAAWAGFPADSLALRAADVALQSAFLAAISLKFDQQLSSKPKPRY